MDVDPDLDEEDMEDVILDKKRERHWSMVLRKIMEGWKMRKRLYMLRGGIST